MSDKYLDFIECGDCMTLYVHSNISTMPGDIAGNIFSIVMTFL
jgi:hypothetical protein